MTNTTEKFVGYAALEPFVLKDNTTHLKEHEYTPRALEDDEVEIKVDTCGICGSDVHQITNGWKTAVYPLVPGHEFIGIITAKGCNVTEHAIGDRVGVSPVSRSCGHCRECTSDYGQLCAKKLRTYNDKYKGVSTYGGYSNKVRVQGAWAIKIPQEISSAEGAPLLCAGITTYLPFKHYNIGENSRVGVVGIGGLGHLALQWAKAKHCKSIVALSRGNRKEEEARSFGATGYIDTEKRVPLEHYKSLDALFVCGSGKSTNWNDLFALLDNHGKFFLLDIAEEPIPVLPMSFVYKHISIIGSFVGSNRDLDDMLQFAAKNGVRPKIQKVGSSLEEVNKGVVSLMEGNAHYRLVICNEQDTAAMSPK